MLSKSFRSLMILSAAWMALRSSLVFQRSRLLGAVQHAPDWLPASGWNSRAAELRGSSQGEQASKGRNCLLGILYKANLGLTPFLH